MNTLLLMLIEYNGKVRQLTRGSSYDLALGSDESDTSISNL